MAIKWKIGLSILFLFLLVAVGFSLWLRSDFISLPLKRLVQDSISRFIAQPVEIKQVRLNLIPSALVLSDVKIPGPDPESPPLFQADEINLSFSPWSLLTEVTIIKKIRITNARLDIKWDIQDPNGPDMLLRLPLREPVSTGPLGRPTVLIIRKIEVKNGKLSVQSTTGNQQIQLGNINALILPDLSMRHYRVDLSSHGGIIQFNRMVKEIDSLETKITLSPDRAEVRKFNLQSKEIKIIVAGMFNYPLLEDYKLTMNLSFPMGTIGEILDLPHELDGQTAFQVEAVSRNKSVSIHGDATIQHPAVDDIEIEKIVSTIHYEDQQLRLSDLEATTPGGSIQGEGVIDFSSKSPSYEFSIGVKQFSLDQVASLLGYPDLFPYQTLDGKADFKGHGFDPKKVSGIGWTRLTLPPEAPRRLSSPTTWQDWVNNLHSLTSEFELKEGVVHLKEGLLEFARTQVLFDGSIGPKDQLDLGLHIKSDEVYDFSPVLRLSFLRGKIDIKGTLRGTVRKPVIKGKGAMTHAVIRGRRFERISGEFRYEHPTLHFYSARVEDRGGTYDLKGMVSFAPSIPAGPYFDFQVNIIKGSPKEIVAIFYRELPLNSRVTGWVKAKGYRKDFRVTGDLMIEPGTLYGQQVDHGRLDLTVTHQAVSFENISAQNGKSVISGSGTIRFDGRYDIHVSSSETHLEDITGLGSRFPHLSTIFSGQLRGSGRFKNPQFEADLHLQNFILGNLPLGQGSLHGEMNERELALTIELDSGLNGYGHLKLSPPFVYEGSVSINQFQMNPILELIQPSSMTLAGDLSGEATGKISFEGNLKNPLKVRSELNLSHLGIYMGDLSLENNKTIEVSLTGNNVEFHSIELIGDGTSLSVSGGLDLFERFQIHIDGEADLGLLRVFIKEVTLGRGTAHLAIQILDEWPYPKIRGNLIVNDGIIKSKTLNQTITIPSLILSFNENQIFLESLEGKIGGGELTATGKWDLDRLSIKEFGINLEIENAQFPKIEGFSNNTDIALVLKGTKETKKLSGEIKVNRARYYGRIDLRPSLMGFFSGDSPESEIHPFLKNLELNLEIIGKENISINNNIANIPLVVDLLIKGKADQPIALGRIEAQGGTFFWRKNEFRIESGSMDFFDTEQLRPIMDIRASTRLTDETGRSYTIELAFLGPLNRPELEVFSTPPLDDHEILMLLAYGRLPTDLEASQGVGAFEGIDLITGGVQIVAEEVVKSVGGFERVQIDPNFSNPKTAGMPVVTVSKRFYEDRLHVTYQTTFNPSEEDVIQIEYIINNNISIVGNRDEEGRIGGDMKLRFEFR